MAQYSAGTASPSVGSTNTPGHPPASTSAPGDAGSQHKRVYQACIPCRRRKVRCDLGSVDNPHDPPCVRCRRESKECFFSATRRKRKNEDDEASDGDEYIIRNGRKRLHSNLTPPRELDRRIYSDVPLTPGGSQGRKEPLRRPDNLSRHDSERSDSRHGRSNDLEPDGANANEQLENVEAQTVMRGALYGPHDALDLLYKAATDGSVATKAMNEQGSTAANVGMFSPPMPTIQHHRQDSRTSSTTAAPSLTLANGRSSGSRGRDGRSMSFKTERPRLFSNTSTGPPAQGVNQQEQQQQPIDPELSKTDPSELPGYDEALRAWTRFRFVRAGWFTPQEAIEYID